MDDVEKATWAVCPFVLKLNAEEGPCKQCPATVETQHGSGVPMCRSLAEEIARAALSALGRWSERD